jgi:hypothetical protein
MRLGRSFGRQFALVHLPLFPHFEVEAQLLVEVPFEALPAEEGPEAAGE